MYWPHCVWEPGHIPEEISSPGHCSLQISSGVLLVTDGNQQENCGENHVESSLHHSFIHSSYGVSSYVVIKLINNNVTLFESKLYLFMMI